MAEAAPNPFPAGDPRSATYNDELATLLHQEERSLADIGSERGQAQTEARTKLSSLSAAEPRSLQAEAFTAANQGLTESSTNAQRRGTVLSGYVEKRGQVGTGLQNTEGRLNKNEQTARENYGQGVKGTADKALEQYRKEQEELNPQTIAAPAAPAAPQLPRIVGERPQPTTAGVRRAAARKALAPRRR